MSDVYPIIAKDDIKAGDQIRVESIDGQRRPRASEYWAVEDGEGRLGLRYPTYRLMSRPTLPLPTEPGTEGWAKIKGVFERCRVFRLNPIEAPYTWTDWNGSYWQDGDLSDFRPGPVDESREEQIEKIRVRASQGASGIISMPSATSGFWAAFAARMYDQGTRVLPTGEEASTETEGDR